MCFVLYFTDGLRADEYIKKTAHVVNLKKSIFVFFCMVLKLKKNRGYKFVDRKCGLKNFWYVKCTFFGA